MTSIKFVWIIFKSDWHNTDDWYGCSNQYWAIICIIVAIAGDTFQDLKTGDLIGSTPKKQKIGELILVFAGVFIAVVVEVLGIPVLPFAIGLYLPIHLSTPMIAGVLVRLYFEKKRKAAKMYASGNYKKEFYILLA